MTEFRPRTRGGSVRSVVHIVPGLVPGECGVGDYAVKLAQMWKTQGVESSFVVGGPDQRNRTLELDARGPFRILPLKVSSPEEMTSALFSLSFDTVLLHMSGFGYEANNAPEWLAKGLAEYRKHSLATIATFFHELWQKPILWKRTIYRWYFERKVIRSVFDSSDAFFTNTNSRFNILRNWDEKKIGLCVPVFSNVGGIDHQSNKENDLAVMFGLARHRRPAWYSLATKFNALEILGIRRIVDIGPSDFELPGKLQPYIVSRGKLSDAAVSDLLARSRYGFIHYEVDQLGKSGVFNAYAAHGVCTINLGRRGVSPDDLEQSRNFLQLEDAIAAGSNLVLLADTVGRAALAWYRPHGLSATSKALIDTLNQVSSVKTPL